MKPTLVLLFAIPLFGGQSIQLTGNSAGTTSLQSLPHSQPSRVEFYIHDWTTSGNTLYIGASDAIGFRAMLYNPGPGNLQLALSNTWEMSPAGGFQAQIGNGNSGLSLPTTGLYVRYQHDPAGVLGAPKTDYAEMWDTNGNRVAFTSTTWSNETNDSGTSASVGGGTDTVNVAFFRIHSTLVPPNSRMPVTSDNVNTLLHWKFDGDLSDSSGHGNTAQLSGGKAVYVNTPYQNIISVIKTMGAPSWTNWVTLRAGQPSQLDGSASFSQADAGASVTCSWQATSGPTTLTWNSQTSCSPTVTGLVFGDYTFQLQVTDAAGNVSTSTQDVGAVAMDDNGVVINSDPNVDLIFGPMIAFGRNPWQYADKQAMYATKLRSAYYDQIGLNPPIWAVAQPGTVSYPFAPLATTLCGSIGGATDSSIVVCDAGKLDLTEFPTHVVVGGLGGEEILVTGTTGTSGQQTLTVGYDGRGYRAGAAWHTAAQGWKSGVAVTQHKVTGQGTSFLTTIAPAGPGWNGTVSYNTGSVAANANSAVLTGTGTNWTLQNLCNQNVSMCGLAVRVSGTHGGTAFTFLAFVASIDSPTQVTLQRVFPADADTASGLSYAFIKAPPDGSGRNLVLHYGRTDNIAYPYDGDLYFLTSACESDTTCYLYFAWDPQSVFPTTGTCLGFSGMECDKHYSYMDSFNYVGDNGGVNFYDEVLAHYALYFRSGWQPALDAARKIAGTDIGADPTKVGWLWYPEFSQGDASPAARRASVTGAVAAAVIDGKVSNWPGLRKMAQRGVNAINDPLGCDNDLREGSAYPLSWLALAALFDPDLNQRANWITQLGIAYTQYDSVCSGFDQTKARPGRPTVGRGTGKVQTDPLHLGSFESGFLWNSNQTPPLTAVQGSAVLTAQSGTISPNICPMVATGTASVTNGSDAVTGPAGFANTPGKIMFFGDPLSPILTFNFIFDNPQQIHLSGLWPGASNSNISWQIDYDAAYAGEPPDGGLVFASSSSDPQLTENWACTLTDTTHLTLDRPWDGPNGTVWGWRAGLGGVGLAGKGTQPFILGIKILQMSYGAYQSGDLGANYNTLANLSANWIKNYGFDPLNNGLYYGRIFQMCEPIFADSSQPNNFPLGFRNPECSYNGGAVGKTIARGLSAEAQNALRVLYQNAPTTENKAFGDQFYGSQWGKAGYSPNAPFADGITSSNISDVDFSNGKWTGFNFGIGMAHQWPAVRAGGVQAARNEKVPVPFNLAAVPSAESVQMIVTQPSGAKKTYLCASSPCEVIVDKRQGTHLVQINYLSATGAVVSQSKPHLLEAGSARHTGWAGLRDPK